MKISPSVWPIVTLVATLLMAPCQLVLILMLRRVLRANSALRHANEQILSFNRRLVDLKFGPNHRESEKR